MNSNQNFRRPPKPFATFTLIKDAMDNEKLIDIYCFEGIKFEKVIVKSFDTYEVTILTSEGNLVSLYKQAIIYIDYGRD